ncbi:MAG: universal stress protein [Caldimonas sp.]
MTIDRILVAVSFSERSIDAVRKAARLAADRSSIITLLHVVEPVKRRSVRHLPTQQTVLRARVTNARKELARYAGEIAAKDRLPVDLRIEVGEKVSSIVRACRDADVLFIGGTTMSGLAAAFHMTTPERLIGKCGIPILVVNGAHQVRYARALIPVDGTYQSVAAVSAAACLWPQAELTLFHAMDSRKDEAQGNVACGLHARKHGSAPSHQLALRRPGNPDVRPLRAAGCAGVDELPCGNADAADDDGSNEPLGQ